MRWKIKGADVNSGEDRVATFDAANQSEAEDRARLNGILVESVKQADVTDANGTPTLTLDYAKQPDRKSKLLERTWAAIQPQDRRSVALRRAAKLRRRAAGLGISRILIGIIGAIVFFYGVAAMLNGGLGSFEGAVTGVALLFISGCLRIASDALESLADLVDWTINQDE